MEARSSMCAACGCALSAGATECPLCGEPVACAGQSAPVLAPNPPFAQAPLPVSQIDAARFASPTTNNGSACRSGSEPAHVCESKKRSKRRVFGIALAAVVVLMVVGMGVLRIWSSDQDLKHRAEASASGSGDLVEVRPAFDPGTGSASGLIAGGGIVVPDGDALYWATSSGVYCQEEVSAASDASMAAVSSDRAACLNQYDGTLYYLASTSSAAAEAYRGQAIRALSDPARDRGCQRTSEVLYRADGADQLGCLSVQDGWMYFVVSHGDEQVVMELPCDASRDAAELVRYTAENAWAFVENRTLYVVSTTATAWTVEAKSLEGETASFEKWGSGSGCLKTACINDGVLYYSLEQGQGASHLYCQEASGAFNEYATVDGVVRIAAGGDVIACVTQTGGLRWIDAVTGFDYDVSDVLNEYMANPVPGLVGLGVSDDWVCSVDNAGSAVAANVNTGNLWVSGEKAEGGSSSSTDNPSDARPSTGPSPLVVV